MLQYFGYVIWCTPSITSRMQQQLSICKILFCFVIIFHIYTPVLICKFNDLTGTNKAMKRTSPHDALHEMSICMQSIFTCQQQMHANAIA